MKLRKSPKAKHKEIRYGHIEDSYRSPNMHVGMLQGENNGKTTFNEILAENYTKLKKDMKPRVEKPAECQTGQIYIKNPC